MTWGRISLIEGDCHRQWRAPSQQEKETKSREHQFMIRFRKLPLQRYVQIYYGSDCLGKKIWVMEANSEAVRRIDPYLAGPSDARSEIISNRYRAYSRQQKQVVILLQSVAALILVPLLQEAFRVDLKINEVCDSRSTWDSREDLRDSS